MTPFVLLAVAAVLAQSPPAALSGDAGWAGAGLLGLVLGWLLLWYLPNKDKQFTDFVKAKDEQIKDMVSTHDARQTADRAAFQQALDKVVAHCAAESRAMLALLTSEGDKNRDSRHEMADKIQDALNRLRQRDV